MLINLSVCTNFSLNKQFSILNSFFQFTPFLLQVIDNLTKIMEDQLETNATTFFMIEMASNSFANVLENNQLVSNDASVSI